MAEDLILAIDQGTTSTRALVVDPVAGSILSKASEPLEQHFPDDGWVEHDAEEIWRAVLGCCRAVIEDVGIERIAAIGITNQRETTVLWDRASGRPVHKAIVWQDRRTAADCERLKKAGLEPVFQEHTGLLLDPYFSGTKLAWLLENVPGARARAEAAELAFGTIDSWIVWQLTGGRLHVTDITNASRTLMCNIKCGDWDQTLLTHLGIPGSVLPKICPSAASFGEAAKMHFGRTLPISGIAGDQQAALVGQACFEPGMIKSTYGTGCFALLNAGAEPPHSTARLLSTRAYGIGDQNAYALEGSIFMAGAAMDWLQTAGLITSVTQIAELATAAKPESNCYLVPAFVGLGAPYWHADARGAFIGMTRDTGRAELVSAALDSVCYQTRDLVEAMAKDVSAPILELRVDGGMTVSTVFLQRLADLCGLRVVRAANTETTAMGAAYLAAIQSGLVGGIDHISQVWAKDGEFTPQMSAAERNQRYEGWQKAVARTL